MDSNIEDCFSYTFWGIFDMFQTPYINNENILRSVSSKVYSILLHTIKKAMSICHFKEKIF